MDSRIQDTFTVLNGRPFLKDPLTFFKINQKQRTFLTITDSVSVWQEDLLLGERMLSDVVVCPFISSEEPTSLETHRTELELAKNVLKQRMKYPGIKESPVLEKIAKTWILPTKLHLGPEASTFLSPAESSISTYLEPIFTVLKSDPMIHLLKLEVKDGQERQFLYKFLDSGYRPSIILVKWSHDLDDHIPTAYCAGHLINTGYTLVQLIDQYAMYIFTEETLYDICSMKTTGGVKNPFITEILNSITLDTDMKQINTE